MRNDESPWSQYGSDGRFIKQLHAALGSSGKLQGTGAAGGAMFLFFALHLLFFLLFGLSWLLEKPLHTATKPAAAAPNPSVAAGSLPKNVGGKGAKSDSGKGKKA